MVQLGVNIDHVATLRQARREFEPDPIAAALICQKAGADSIVAHLREDRRHILDRDIPLLKKKLKCKFNLEMSIHPSVVAVALKIKPDQVTIVPERRQEITTEGGLDVVRNFAALRKPIDQLNKKRIIVSLFIAPDQKQIDATDKLGVKMIELHTGQYAIAKNSKALAHELKRLTEMTQYALSLGMIVNAGHGLKYDNTYAVAAIPGMGELNIGHSIISRAVFVGIEKAVKEMIAIIRSVK